MEDLTMAEKKKAKAPEDPMVKELRHVKSLLMLLLLKLGTTSEELDIAVGMGASNIRTAFPIRKIKKLTMNLPES
jgi:hypothetical protein